MMSARPLPRAVIFALAALAFLYFFEGFQIAFNVISRDGLRWDNALPALAPLCAFASAGLAFANIRLVLAGLLLIATPLLYFAPILPFAIAVMIYGAAP